MHTKEKTVLIKNVNKIKILGLDPGSHVMGYGLVSCYKGEITYMDSGVFSLPSSMSFPLRLYRLGECLEGVFKKYSPHHTVVENIFLGVNVSSAFKLGHVRGVCLEKGIQFKNEIFEYAPRQVKKWVVGSGAASKASVRDCLFQFLNIQLQTPLDATDALALAYVHGSKLRTQDQLKKERCL